MNKLNLEKIRKCEQVWEEMKVNESGRICEKCRNTIIDFRSMTAAEVARTHMFSDGKVCGLYREDQLQMKVAEKKYSSWSSAAIALLGMFSSMNLLSQNSGETPAIELHEPEYNDKIQKPSVDTLQEANQADSVLVYGTVRNTDGEALIGVAVFMKGTTTGTVTDAQGYYVLDIKEAIQNSSRVVVVYSYVGVKTEELLLDKNTIMTEGSLEVNPLLEEDYSAEMDFVVLSKNRFHHRMWRGIKGIFKKKR